MQMTAGSLCHVYRHKKATNYYGTGNILVYEKKEINYLSIAILLKNDEAKIKAQMQSGNKHLFMCSTCRCCTKRNVNIIALIFFWKYLTSPVIMSFVSRSCSVLSCPLIDLPHPISDVCGLRGWSVVNGILPHQPFDWGLYIQSSSGSSEPAHS